MRRVLRSQSDYRHTLLRNQLTSLVLFEAITTTETKAKSLVSFTNHFFNRIKAADLVAKRHAHKILFDKNAVKKVFEEVLPRYDKKATTFVRILRMTPRHGDNAKQALVSLLEPLKIEPVEAKKTEAKVAKTKKTTAKKVKK